MKNAREFVKLLTVAKGIEVKKDGSKQTNLRLIWDCRRVNCRFRQALWVPLGSPAAMGLIELGERVVQRRQFATFQGDVPDWFYILGLPEGLREWFVLEEVDPVELFEHAKKNGVDIPEPAMDDVGVGAKINPMGFSWAVFLAHSCLTDSFDAMELGRSGEIRYPSPTPSFLECELLRVLHIDDYTCGLLIEEAEVENSAEFRAEGSLVKEALEGRGIPIHKECSGIGMERGLGLTITEFPTS